ncbi:hypothetical protein RhiirB3_389905 [Rhizophagus irregularis]|nr:hypothetical protein RhiirB3_389905 [Rhizophagus irregularis]
MDYKDEKWIKAATTLSETLKHQAQTEEVKIFWRNIDLKRKEMEAQFAANNFKTGNDVHMIQNRSRTEYVSNLHATTSQKTVANGRVLESQGTHKTNRSNLHSIEPTRKKPARKRKSICYTESSEEEDHSSDQDYTEKPRKKEPRSKRLREKANRDGMDKGDIIIKTSEDENTPSPAQPTMTSNTYLRRYYFVRNYSKYTPTNPTSFDISEDFSTSRESTPCPVARPSKIPCFLWRKQVKITGEGNVEMTDEMTEQDLTEIDQLPCATVNNALKKIVQREIRQNGG